MEAISQLECCKTRPGRLSGEGHGCTAKAGSVRRHKLSEDVGRERRIIGGGETDTKLYTSVFGRMVGSRVRTTSTCVKTTSGWEYGCMFWRSHLWVSDSVLLIAGDKERSGGLYAPALAPLAWLHKLKRRRRRQSGRCRRVGPGATRSTLSY